MATSEPEVLGEPATSSPAAPPAIDPASLVQAISGGSANPMSLLLSQLTAQAPDDPRVALVTQMLQQRLSTPAAVAAEEPQGDESGQRDEKEAGEQAHRILELTGMLRRLDAEMKVLRARNDALAAALGACFLCFGTDPYCPECRGRGAPGSRPPEPVAWRDYVLPALARVRKIQSTRPGSVPRPQPAPRMSEPAAGAAPPQPA